MATIRPSRTIMNRLPSISVIQWPTVSMLLASVNTPSRNDTSLIVKAVKRKNDNEQVH